MLFADIDWPVLKDLVLGVVAGVVSLGIPFFSYMTIRMKLKEANHEMRIRGLEQHVKECVELVETPWPSDDFNGKSFMQRVMEARSLARANGFPWTMKEVAILAKKYLKEKGLPKPGQSPTPPESEGGFYS